jgi:hypothetical protein
LANFILGTLPIAISATPGSVVSLSTILTQAFGTSLGGSSNFWLTYYGASQLQVSDFSYWNPSQPEVAQWYVNGADIGAGFGNQRYLPLANISTASLHVGNDIGPFAYVTVPIAGPSGAWTEYVQYSIVTVDPSLISPTVGNGDPTAADVVAAAYRFAAKYVDVPNNNDCHFIDAAVAAAAGATLDVDNTQSLDPTENEEGGFWRIVYRGSNPNPVSDWQTLVQPGDIVRMGWQSGGQHTTLVLGVNPDGSLLVYDNADYDANNTEIIGIHNDVNYYENTIPSTITIYRLSSDDLYLINGSNGAVSGETLTGNQFNDEFAQLSPNDTVIGGSGWNEAILNVVSSAATIHHANGNATVSYSGFTDTFNDVEVLKFTDKTVAVRTRAQSDFDDTGTSDILFRNGSTGDTWFEAVSHGSSAAWNQIGGSDTHYSVVGQGHFYGDNASDILFRNNSTGDTWFEAMNDGAANGWNQIGGSDTHYSVVGVGDFYGSGTDDILYRNSSSGDTWVEGISSGAASGWYQIGGSNSSYSVTGVGDFFGNGTDDILFRNSSTGDTWFEAISNGASNGWHQIGGSDTHYSVVGVGDFYGNGTEDILFRNSSTGDTWIEQISNGAFAGWSQVGGSNTGYAVVAVGDYFGNGTSDILFRNNSSGDTWLEAISNGASAGWNQIGGSNTSYTVKT